MKRRTLFTLIIVLVLALTSALAFVGCNKNKDGHPKDDSFVGCVSQKTYEDETSAVRGFLNEEIDGKTTQTQFVNAEKGKTLNDGEIAKLKLGETIKATEVESASYFTVTYLETAQKRDSLEESAPSKNYEIIVLKIGSGYRYYIPALKDGSALPSAYIQNVCNPIKYLNVTETVEVVSTAQAEGMAISVVMEITIKIDWNKAYMRVVMGVLGQTEVQEYYIASENNALYMYSYDNYYKWWIPQERLPFSNFEDYVFSEFFNFDHSYFERTNTGFKINERKGQEFLSDVLSNTLNGMDVGYNLGRMSVDYFVKNGKLDEVIAEFSMDASAVGTQVQTEVTMKTKYSDYGTTVVELPKNMD